MNFTREPLIETVITPREGCRLVLRNSKVEGREELAVEAVEVISFGTSIFYRSTENSKPFLLPIGDYELVEQKEVRIPLKNAAPQERSLKIGGGRPPESQPQDDEQRGGRRDRRRGRRGRRGGNDMHQRNEAPQDAYQPQNEQEEPPQREETPGEPKAPPISRLLPPPPTLIKETLSRYKTADEFSPLPPPLYHALPTDELPPTESQSDDEEPRFDT